MIRLFRSINPLINGDSTDVVTTQMKQDLIVINLRSMATHSWNDDKGNPKVILINQCYIVHFSLNFWMWCFSSSLSFHGSPVQFNLSSSFSGAVCETYQCNFTAVSCFDL